MGTYAALAVTAPAATAAPAPTTPKPSRFMPIPNLATSCPPFCGVFAPALAATYFAPPVAVEAPAFTEPDDPNPVFAGPPIDLDFSFSSSSFRFFSSSSSRLRSYPSCRIRSSSASASRLAFSKSKSSLTLVALSPPSFLVPSLEARGVVEELAEA